MSVQLGQDMGMTSEWVITLQQACNLGILNACVNKVLKPLIEALKHSPRFSSRVEIKTNNDRWGSMSTCEIYYRPQVGKLKKDIQEIHFTLSTTPGGLETGNEESSFFRTRRIT